MSIALFFYFYYNRDELITGVFLLIPVEERTRQLEIKKSLFIAAAHPVKTEEAVKGLIRDARAEHPKCSHVVWAYILGDEKSQALGMSDDGEPKGTAGKPALAVLQYSGLTNILVTVVRYFGGIKLGKGGLVKAYTGSVKAVIDDIPVKIQVTETVLHMRFGYADYDGIRKALKQHRAAVEQEHFETGVSLVCRVEEKRSEQLRLELMDITRGNVIITES